MSVTQSTSRINKTELNSYFPKTLKLIEEKQKLYLLKELAGKFSISEFFEFLRKWPGKKGLEFLYDLARLEFFLKEIEINNVPELDPDSIVINPTMHLLEVFWKGLPAFLNNGDSFGILPADNPEYVLLYKNIKSGKTKIREAQSNDLLVLKIIAENIDLKELQNSSGLSLRAIEDIIHNAAGNGLIIKSASHIFRDPNISPKGNNISNEYFTADFFTLQWHITQKCDLKCKHCYDRSDRSEIELKAGLKIIDEFRDFCDNRNVRGQISFTGGNPLLHPDFFDFYQAGKNKGLYMAILGNPVSHLEIEKILEIEMPEFYQVSLEGLEEHNDYIRGKGHFRNIMEFLDLLKKYNIYSMVMLTLTKDNIKQVLPLAELLQDKTDKFTFNRLAAFGEGANLSLPDKNEYIAFLKEYHSARKHNSVLGIKDNLFNIIKVKEGSELFGGCTGYGCGAAFNFMTLLSDGEVHACRKMPSLIGNIHMESLDDIYDSEIAEKYRLGTSACAHCSIRPVCGGCSAVALSHGFDIFNEKDPMCFIDSDI